MTVEINEGNILTRLIAALNVFMTMLINPVTTLIIELKKSIIALILVTHYSFKTIMTKGITKKNK